MPILLAFIVNASIFRGKSMEIIFGLDLREFIEVFGDFNLLAKFSDKTTMLQ